MSETDSNQKKTLSDFSLTENLGEGSYSSVILATDKQSNQQYAIKILTKKQIIKEKKTKYVQIEKEVLQRCNHDLIVKLYYTFQDNSCLYFVLEYAENGDLLGLVKKYGSLNLECCKFYACEILTSIEYLHSLSIIHRDLKPENILITGDWHIRLTDFGTAKILNQEPETQNEVQRSNSFVGTAEYVSPELLKEKAASASSDLWAFGCVLFQMISGKPPFKASNDYQIFQKISKLDYVMPNYFPTGLRDLITKLLVLDPSERLPIEQIKSHSFFSSQEYFSTDNPIWKTTPPQRSAYEEATVESGRQALIVNTDVVFSASNELSPLSAVTPRSPVESLNEKWKSYVYPGETIIHSGRILKKRYFFSKPLSRYLILTDKNRLFYIDEDKMQEKGDITIDSSTVVEVVSDYKFNVTSGSRTFLFEDLDGNSKLWYAQIKNLVSTVNKT